MKNKTHKLWQQPMENEQFINALRDELKLGIYDKDISDLDILDATKGTYFRARIKRKIAINNFKREVWQCLKSMIKLK